MIHGAIIGDIVGSRFETMNYKHKDFHLFAYNNCFTDDSVMTVAVAEALLTDGDFVSAMQKWGRKYPRAGYGGNFYAWIFSDDPRPYGSWGNGSAMRVSPCGLVARFLEEALDLAWKSAAVTHNHPQGIRGAQAIAAAVYMAKTGCGREEIRAYIEKNFYHLGTTLDEIRPGYGFDVSCQGSVPQAILCFLESEDFEDAIRNAISLGGDSDTIAAMAGSIAWVYYSRDNGPTPRMAEIWAEAAEYVPDDMMRIVRRMSEIVDR